MILSSIEKIAENIGYDIGMSNDKIQSDLLNGFSNALHNSMNKSNLDMQICYIVNNLNENSCNIIKTIYEFINLKGSK